MQTRMRELLSDVAQPRTSANAVPFKMAIANDLVLSFYGVQAKGRRLNLFVLGTPVDRLQYETMRLLETVGAEKVLACPECGRLFLKVTKKRFCSTKCQSRVYMRAYRERNK
jgi:hypothetical protein